jgi:amidase
LLQKALDQMKAQGATIVELEFMKPYEDLGNDEFLVLEYEFKDGLNQYLQSAGGKMKSIDDIIAFNKNNEGHVMPFFRQEIMDSSATKEGIDNKKYVEAHTRLQTIKKLMNDLMSKNNLDALCGPASGPSWCIDLVNGDHFTGYGAYGPAAAAGFPSITVPMGTVHDLPVGISFVGRAYDEPGLISIAYAYEQASMNRIAPKFISTVAIK